MEFESPQIYQIAETIWNATLGVPIAPDSGQACASSERATAACIQITGAWNGAILLVCPADVARHAASVMFSAAPAEMKVADLQDAVAELVNMIGGNIKGLLPETCHLSLPAVVEGGDYSTRIPGSRLATKIAFDCDGKPVSISILEKIAQQTAAA